MNFTTVFENRAGQPFDRFAALMIAFLCLFAILIIRFALIQNVWIDEATQLSGVTLSLSRMLAWLSGNEPGIFVVPDDRMPPVSYLLDWGWVRLFGDGETGLRLFHGALLFLGVVFLTAALLQRFGTRVAFIFALLVALSPKIIGFAPEIRAYPIFFGLACAATAYFLKLADEKWDGAIAPLIPLGVFSALSIYTHFFGVVMMAAFFGALAVRYILDRQKLLKIVGAGTVTAITTLGVLPFVFAAQGMTRSRANASGIGEYIEYFLTLIAGPANVVYPLAAALFFAGVGALVLTGLVSTLRDVTRKGPATNQSIAILSLAGAIGFGIGATVIANVFSQSLYAIKISYSLWLFPVIASLIAISFTQVLSFPIWDRFGRWAALGFIIIGSGVATLFFAGNQQLFIHGLTDEIAGAAAATNKSVTIIYERKSDYAHGAIPVGWRLGNGVEQWVDQRSGDAIEAGGLEKFIMGVNAVPETKSLEALETVETILVVDINLRTFKELRDAPADPAKAGPKKPVARALLEDRNWDLVNSHYRHGLYSGTIWRFERTKPKE